MYVTISRPSFVPFLKTSRRISMIAHSVKVALLGDLILRLRNAGNWCGETHVQKTVYFLQTARQLALGYAFVLYKNAPYSFDLKLEMSRLFGRQMLVQVPSNPPYGPRLNVTKIMENYISRRREMIDDHSKHIDCVVQFVGRRGVAELERLSTALYVSVANGDEPVGSRARRMHELKPHISVQSATMAVEQLDASSIRGQRN